MRGDPSRRQRRGRFSCLVSVGSAIRSEFLAFTRAHVFEGIPEFDSMFSARAKNKVDAQVLAFRYTKAPASLMGKRALKKVWLHDIGVRAAQRIPRRQGKRNSHRHPIRHPARFARKPSCSTASRTDRNRHTTPHRNIPSCPYLSSWRWSSPTILTRWYSPWDPSR